MYTYMYMYMYMYMCIYIYIYIHIYNTHNTPTYNIDKGLLLLARRGDPHGQRGDLGADARDGAKGLLYNVSAYYIML